MTTGGQNRPWLAMVPIVVILSGTEWWAKPAVAQPQPPRPSRPQPDVQRLREEGREVFGFIGSDARQAPAQRWTIVLAGFHGENHEAIARDVLERVQHQAGLREAALERRGKATLITFGQYDDPDSRTARQDLERLRNIEMTIGGVAQRPFRHAFLIPPPGVPGSIPEYDLRNVRRLHGPEFLYTLQVGVYSREDGQAPSASDLAEFRRAAEQAAIALRREGELAFYYHGPRRSMVTVGLFTREDFDPQTPGIESPALRATRQRFPYNLLNGGGIRETIAVTDRTTGQVMKRQRLQPSRLVNLPADDLPAADPQSRVPSRTFR